MKAKSLYLLSGAPGSGKSYWAKHRFMPWILHSAYISRDEVRYSMLNDGDEYFSKEKAVFNEFIHRINKAIDNPEITSIVVDATHLNWASRNKTLSKLHLNDVDVIPVVFNTPLDICLNRNDTREGRANVPHSALIKMYNSRTDPSTDPFEYCYILNPYKMEVS